MIALEYPFNLVIYLVAMIVIIGLIFNFRAVASTLNLCQFNPAFCETPQKCETVQTSEGIIDENVLNKYCNLCWRKTAEVDFKDNCFCYSIKGDFTPQSPSLPEFCKLKCDKPSTAVFVNFNYFTKKVNIEC